MALMVPNGQATCSTNGKPNILVIMAHDIGWFNSNGYTRWMVGFSTPNIDLIVLKAMFVT